MLASKLGYMDFQIKGKEWQLNGARLAQDWQQLKTNRLNNRTEKSKV